MSSAIASSVESTKIDSSSNENTYTSSGNPKIISVIDEINRGKEYSRCLQQRHSCLETIVKPIYSQNQHPAYPDVFVKRYPLDFNKNNSWLF